MPFKLEPYIRASYPILYLLTAEEARAELTVLKAAKELKRNIRIWSHTEGFFSPDGSSPDSTEDPVEALTLIKKTETPNTIYVFRDLQAFMEHPRIRRLLRDIAKDFKQSRRTLIIISPLNKIPPDVERDITLLEFDLPTKEEIKTTFDTLYNENKKAIGSIEEDEVERIVQSAMGLTTCEAEGAFAKAVVERSNGAKDVSISHLVLMEKANAVKKTGILEYFAATETAKDIGGLDNLKRWIEMRAQAFSKKAREFGLPMPRGILLTGLPGTGKSLSAKATSNIMGVPLIRFDIGRVFGSLVGQSEQQMRTAIQTAEAIGSCVLWVDEMEKAFAGMGSSSSGDSGTSQRVFGNFLTWMQEKKCPCFIVATVNRIDGLPPELLRKGRFDEIFYVGLPSVKEREEILKIHITRFKRDPKNFDVKELAQAADMFSGAELEEAIVSGMYVAFYQNRELETGDIMKALKATNPLAKSKGDVLQTMAAWAEKNAMSANAVTGKDKGSGRQLEI